MQHACGVIHHTKVVNFDVLLDAPCNLLVVYYYYYAMSVKFEDVIITSCATSVTFDNVIMNARPTQRQFSSILFLFFFLLLFLTGKGHSQGLTNPQILYNFAKI